MIGLIKGILLEKKPPVLLVDTGGVAYQIEVPVSTLYELPEVGSEVVLRTHMLVRDDAHILYGFASDIERQLFRSLLKVSGVGAKMALAILSGATVDGFVRHVREGNAAALVRIPGVGKKTAERLVMEMRDRIDAIDGLNVAAIGNKGIDTAADEAFGALVSLGYKPAEVSRMIARIDSENLSTEDLIREVLKQAAR